MNCNDEMKITFVHRTMGFVHRTMGTDNEGRNAENDSIHAEYAECIIDNKGLNHENHILYGVGAGIRDPSHAKLVLSEIFFGESKDTIVAAYDELMKMNQEDLIRFIDTFRGLSPPNKEKYCREFVSKR